MKRAWLLIAVTVLIGTSVDADDKSGPIYSPVSKSYFQLFSDNTYPGTWVAAKQRAEAHRFRGVKGRLAVVDSPEIDRFIISRFGFKHETWIGLRYWCSFRKLQWINGEAFSPADRRKYTNWHAKWYRSDETICGTGTLTSHDDYMPVYYLSIAGAARWQAVGDKKWFKYYLVEYPTKGE